MSSLQLLLEAAADQIRETMDSEADLPIQVEPRLVLNPTPPTIDLSLGSPSSDPATANFAATYIDEGEAHIIAVRALVNPNDNVANQDLLVEFADPASSISVVQALYDDPTLGGLATDVSLVAPHNGFERHPNWDGTRTFLGLTWRFLVIPARS